MGGKSSGVAVGLLCCWARASAELVLGMRCFWHKAFVNLVCMHGMAWRKLLVRQAWAVTLSCGSFALVLISKYESNVWMGRYRGCRTPLP